MSMGNSLTILLSYWTTTGVPDSVITTTYVKFQRKLSHFNTIKNSKILICSTARVNSSNIRLNKVNETNMKIMWLHLFNVHKQF